MTAGDRARAPVAVLFDVDGTLVDTMRLYLESYRRALAPVLGRAPGDQEILARRPSAERRFLEDWVGAEQAAGCHAEMCRQYEALHGALCEGVYEGVREMLAALRAAGFRLGVVTGKGRAAWTATDRHLGLGPFEVVVTEDDAGEPKPHPGGLLAAAEALRVAPAQTLYVGDSESDLAAGRAAGMLVGAALWPKTAPGERDAFVARIGAHHPEWAFAAPADITRALAGWC